MHFNTGRKQSAAHIFKRVESMRNSGGYARSAAARRATRHPNRDALKKEYMRVWRQKNPEKVKAAKRRSTETKRVHLTNYENNRRAGKLQATPRWANLDYIAGMYEVCGLFRSIWLDLEVDHIVPLKGKNVCGLHVENNLQLLHAKDNRVNKNRWTDVLAY